MTYIPISFRSIERHVIEDIWSTQQVWVSVGSRKLSPSTVNGRSVGKSTIEDELAALEAAFPNDVFRLTPLTHDGFSLR